MRFAVWPGAMSSSPRAKIPGWVGASRTLKFDSQRNHRDHAMRRWSKAGSKLCFARDSVTRRARPSMGAPFSNRLLAACKKRDFLPFLPRVFHAWSCQTESFPEGSRRDGERPPLKIGPRASALGPYVGAGRDHLDLDPPLVNPSLLASPALFEGRFTSPWDG